MIGLLRGTIISKRLNSALVEVAGVGYQLQIPHQLAETLLLDATAVFFTHLAVREDALTLYGFASEEDRDVFEILIGISGIGPKIGLAILSTYSPAEVQAAVSSGNTSAFSAVSGIGKKNAERIVLELKNKVWTTAAFNLSQIATGSELTQALVALGYSLAEAGQLSQAVDQSLPLEQQIKQALKRTS